MANYGHARSKDFCLQAIGVVERGGPRRSSLDTLRPNVLGAQMSSDLLRLGQPRSTSDRP